MRRAMAIYGTFAFTDVLPDILHVSVSKLKSLSSNQEIVGGTAVYGIRRSRLAAAVDQKLATRVGDAFFGDSHQKTVPGNHDARLPRPIDANEKIGNFLVFVRQSNSFLGAHGGIITRVFLNFP
jgi:hypothetical protein